MSDPDIDIGNYQGVASGGGDILVMLPKRTMTKTEALVHAAWLVALADESDDNEDFHAILRAVCNT